MNGLAFGGYIPGDTVVHRLDPRAKLLFVFGLMTLIFMSDGIGGNFFLLVFVLGAVRVTGLSWKAFFRSARPVLWFIALTAVLHLVLTRGGETVFSLPFLTVHEEGIRQALLTANRLFLLAAAASLLTVTTTPIDLTDGIERLLSPLARLRFPAHELALMMSITLRFIPVLWEETERIRMAQTARGADFESGFFLRRLKSYIPVLIPLLVASFRRADELSMAMESRCYRGGAGRTKWRRLRLTRLDFMLFVLFAGLAAAVAVLEWLEV